MPAPTDGRRRSLLLGACCALAFGGCGGAKPTSELVELAKSKDSSDRIRAVRELSERGAEREMVVPVLAQALRDEDAFVRRDAARGLGELGPAASSAISALQTAALDKNQHVREAVTGALRKVAPELPPPPDLKKKR